MVAVFHNNRQMKALSPIVYQFKFIYQIAAHLKDYSNTSSHNEDTIKSHIQSLQQDPLVNSYDFWWLHKYFIEGSRLGFAAATLLLLIIVYMAKKLWEHNE